MAEELRILSHTGGEEIPLDTPFLMNGDMEDREPRGTALGFQFAVDGDGAPVQPQFMRETGQGGEVTKDAPHPEAYDGRDPTWATTTGLRLHAQGTWWVRAITLAGGPENIVDWSNWVNLVGVRVPEEGKLPARGLLMAAALIAVGVGATLCARSANGAELDAAGGARSLIARGGVLPAGFLVTAAADRVPVARSTAGGSLVAVERGRLLLAPAHAPVVAAGTAGRVTVAQSTGGPLETQAPPGGEVKT